MDAEDITAECAGCASLRAAADEAHDIAADAEARAAMWQGIGLGAWVVAGLVVVVLVAIARRGAAADEAGG